VKKFLLGVLALLIVAFIAVALALPGLAKSRINDSLAHLEGYKGHVDGVGFALIVGRFTLKRLSIWDTTKGDFKLEVPKLTTRVSWGALLHRELVVDVEADEPVITMVAPKPEKAAKKTAKKAQKAEANVEQKTGKTIGQELQDLMPFRVNSFRIVDGAIVIKEGAANEQEAKKEPKGEQRPGQPVKLHDIDLVVRDLTNTSERQPATAKGKAEIAGGAIELAMNLKPLEKQPTFDLRAEIKDVDLAQLDPLLRWQFNVDVKKGKFDLVSEVKAANGGFDGYVKPFIQDLEAGSTKHEGPIKKAKEIAVDVVAKVLENKKTKEVATKVPFSGRFDQPKTDIWTAVATVLSNAFIKALSPSFEKL